MIEHPAPEPTPLPGWSALTFIARGAALEVLASILGMLITFESFFGDRWYLWGGTLAVLALSCLMVGAILGIRGYQKLKAERSRGYTTSLSGKSISRGPGSWRRPSRSKISSSWFRGRGRLERCLLRCTRQTYRSIRDYRITEVPAIALGLF
jgi:hypothetical protein